MTTPVLSILNGSSSFLHTISRIIKAWMSLNFVKIPSLILELAPLEHLKNRWIMLCALASTFLIGSSLFFQLTRTLIKAWMSLKYCRI